MAATQKLPEVTALRNSASRASRQFVRFGSKTGNTRSEQMTSALPPKADSSQTSGHVRKVPTTDSCTAAKLIVDHLVGQREQRVRHGEAERIRGLTINDEFELRRQLDGQVRRLCAFED